MWTLVAGPVLLGLIIAGFIFLPVGPVLAMWAKQLRDWIIDTLATMRDIWRSE